jgi:AbrB family looped-hinge helix DNA binding protein
MARVTSKRQLTLPKAITDRYGIEPGDELDLVPAGDGLRMVPPARRPGAPTTEERLARFDAATERARTRLRPVPPGASARGWAREDLYRRGGAG